MVHCSSIGPRRRSFWLLGALTVSLGAAVLANLGPAHAELQTMQSSANAITIKTSDSSIADVLDALGVRFQPRFRDMLAAERPVSQTYSGSNSQILSRLLERYDFIASTSASGAIELLWIKPSGRKAGSLSSRPVVAPVVQPSTTSFINRPPPVWRNKLDEHASKHQVPQQDLASVGNFREHCLRTPACRAVFR